MNNCAFIFARGGSKGLPRKNIKELAGKPLLGYAVESAKSCHFISNVFVSTDDPEIAEVAKQFGAIVIPRPDDLAQDTSPEWLAWRHAISWVEDNYGSFDYFFSLPTTSPLRAVEDIEHAWQKLKEQKADICISVTPSSRSPYFNMIKHNQDGFAELVNTVEGGIAHRQDAPEVFDITTVVYVSTPNFIKNSYGVFSGTVITVIVPKERAVDIDDIYDFEFAEFLISRNKK